MTGARQSWLVATRELRERTRSRGFYLSFALMLIGVVAAIVLPGLIDDGTDQQEVGLVGAAPPAIASEIEAQGDAVDVTVRVRRYDTVADGEEAVRDGEVDVLVVDSVRLEWRTRAEAQLEAVVRNAIQRVSLGERAAAAGIGPDQLLELVEPVPLTSIELGSIRGRSPDDETAALIMTLVLFGAISTYGGMVLSGIVEEKSSRTVEVLLARMPARNLLAGKVIGIGLLGLGQVVATALVALAAGAVVDSIEIPAIGAGVLTWAVIWFLLGYALYATVYGALGSLASRTEDGSSVTGPVTVALILAFFVSFATVGSPDTTWARAVSWFPLTAPMAMPNRIAMGAASWWDPFLAAVLTVAAIAGLVVLGGRVYTRAILHTGSTLSLGDAWRGAPAPPRRGDAVSEGRDDRATTTRPDRLQVVLVIVALVAGVVAFAVTKDFVVGVGVGAAGSAVAVRGTRWLRRRDKGPPDNSRVSDRESVSR